MLGVLPYFPNYLYGWGAIPQSSRVFTNWPAGQRPPSCPPKKGGLKFVASSISEVPGWTSETKDFELPGLIGEMLVF